MDHKAADVSVIVPQPNKSKICKACSSSHKVFYGEAYINHEGSDSAGTICLHLHLERQVSKNVQDPTRINVTNSKNQSHNP